MCFTGVVCGRSESATVCQYIVYQFSKSIAKSYDFMHAHMCRCTHSFIHVCIHLPFIKITLLIIVHLSPSFWPGYPSSDGFFTVRQGYVINHHRSSSCQGRFKISLKFVCDRDRMWDPLIRNTLTHVRDGGIVITDHCHVSKD